MWVSKCGSVLSGKVIAKVDTRALAELYSLESAPFDNRTHDDNQRFNHLHSSSSSETRYAFEIGYLNPRSSA